MRYVLLIGALIVIIGGLAVFLLYPSSNHQPASGSSGAVFPGSGSGTGSTASSTPSAATLSLAASDGGTVSSRDFLSDADVSSPASGYYYLGFHAGTDPYQIIFQSSSRIFTIELLKEPIGATRSQAEQYLAAKLGLSQSDLCRLDYTLSVPQTVNSTYASRNLLFSFCPGAVSLPQ